MKTKRAFQILLVLLVGTIGSVFADWLKSDFPTAVTVGVIIAIATMCIIAFSERYPKYFGFGVATAASALVFKNDKVLLIFNNRQKKWIPPGAHVRRNQHPHKVAVEAFKNDSGYEVLFHRWHNVEFTVDRLVKQVPQPYYVQVETQLPGEGHLVHYDLIFLCSLASGAQPIGGRTNHKWVKINEIVDENTYPDVAKLIYLAYKDIIS